MSEVTDDQMSPDASPGGVSKRAGVRRVNNMPMYIVGGLMAVFLLIMVLVAADRAAKQHRPAEVPPEKAGNTSMFAKEIAGDRQDGIIPPKGATPVAIPPDLAPPNGAVPIARPVNLDTPPTPPNSQNPQMQSAARDAAAEAANRMRMMKAQQFEEAVKAKTSVNTIAPRSPGSTAPVYSGVPPSRDEQLARLAAARAQIDATTRDDPTAAYKARLAQLQAAGILQTGATSAPSGAPFMGTSAALPAPPSAATGNSVDQFDKTGEGDRWKLNSRPEAPRTPYELRTGFVVPATLISGINSELPGQIMAQVSQDVFDTPTGKHLLIPQGSRLVGTYSSNVAYGQARVLIAWLRIIFPDGKAMDIGSMPGADSAGYAGLTDQVNNHYVRLFASAFLMSSVTAGIALSQPQQSATSTTNTTSGALSQALGQQLGAVTAQLISKNLNIAPTLEIRPGFRFNVMVTKDMTFSKPYQAFDY